MYAKFINETLIDTQVPSHVIYNGKHWFNPTDPQVLASIKYYLLIEASAEPPSEEIAGFHYEKRYKLENNTVVEEWVSIEDAPEDVPAKVYSKLKILMAADEAGFADALMDMIEADRKTKYMWDASNTIEDNALLQAYLPGIADALGKTEQELKAFLDQYCVAD